VSEHPTQLVNFFPVYRIRMARHWLVENTVPNQLGESHPCAVRLVFQVLLLFFRETDERDGIHLWFWFVHTCPPPLV